MENSVTENEEKIIEKERIYIYPSDIRMGEVMLTPFIDVTRVDVQPDGSHIVYTASGHSQFVSKGFVNIQAIPANNKEGDKEC